MAFVIRDAVFFDRSGNPRECATQQRAILLKKKGGEAGKGRDCSFLCSGIIGAVSSAATQHSSDWVWKLNGFQVSLTHTMKFPVQSAPASTGVLSLAATPSCSRGYLLMTDKQKYLHYLCKNAVSC